MLWNVLIDREYRKTCLKTRQDLQEKPYIAILQFCEGRYCPTWRTLIITHAVIYKIVSVNKKTSYLIQGKALVLKETFFMSVKRVFIHLMILHLRIGKCSMKQAMSFLFFSNSFRPGASNLPTAWLGRFFTPESHSRSSAWSFWSNWMRTTSKIASNSWSAVQRGWTLAWLEPYLVEWLTITQVRPRVYFWFTVFHWEGVTFCVSTETLIYLLSWNNPSDES